MSSCDLLVHHAHLATMRPGGGPYGSLSDGVLVIDGDRIRWMGPRVEAPDALIADPAETLDAGGGWVTPGLIDAHTHLVFGGDRAAERERRLGGATYEEIAREGGGILSTVRRTRAASDDELFRSGLERVDALRREGVTTVEVKSGYGLDVETELRMLSVARRLGDARPVTVRTTLLAAHALPPEHSDDRAGYLDLVCEDLVPRAAEAGLADQIDAFCEGIAFTPEECARVLRAGAERGLGGRLHADQLSDLGGAALAAELGARSADHLEHASEDGVRAMAGAGTIAMLLPGAYLFLGETRVPPVGAMREHLVPMAVATDLNPGSSPLASPLLAMGLACTLFGLTPEEALAGMTRVAAAVLGLEGDRGVLAAGLRADLAVWHVEHPSELSYWMGLKRAAAVVQAGRVVTDLG